MRPSTRSSAAVSLALILAASCSGERPRDADEPVQNVVFISLDSVRADALTFLDLEVSPNLARLARSGTIFTQAVSGSSWTLPTHVQMFSGQPPSLSRVEVDSVCIDANTPLVTEGLRAAGFATIGFWTGWYLAPEYGFGRGFQVYRSAMTGGPERLLALERSLEEAPTAELIESQTQLELESHKDVTSGHVVREARAALADLDPRTPLFLFAHLFDPHFDYVPPGDWATRFDPDYDGEVSGRDYWSDPKVWDPVRNVRTCSERDLEHVRALYRGEIGWSDENIGELIDLLETQGRLKSTLFVVTADHGEEFFEHGGRGHRANLFDESLRVPLLIVLPESLRAGVRGRVEAQVSLSDLMPTIYDYTGLELPPGVEGRSLRPLLEGTEFGPRPIVASLQVQSPAPGGGQALILHEAVRTRREKLVRTTLISPGKQQQILGLAFFDLAGDPLELAPLAGNPQELLAGNKRVRGAWQRLENGLAEFRRLAAERPRQKVAERTTNMARQLDAELRKLGYVDMGGSGDNAAGLLPDWGLDVRPAMPLAR